MSRGLAGLLMAGVTAACWAQQRDGLDRAIAQRENEIRDEVSGWAASVGMTPAELGTIRHRNARKELAKLPSVGEVMYVSINRTSDTQEPTIHLVFVDGQRATLWCREEDAEGAMKVRTVTGY